MNRAPALLAALALAASLAVGLPSAASAVPTSSAPSGTLVAPDFASDMYGDPWDFSNPEDLLLDRGPTMMLESPRIADGLLQFSMRTQGYVSPLWGGYPGGLYIDREGGAPDKRLDADRYTRFSLHAYSSREVSAGLQWWSCEGLDATCMGGRGLTLRPGWHTYDVELRNEGYGLPQEWAGPMTGLRLALSPAQPTDFAIDWMRTYEPVDTVQVPGGTVWDVDDELSDNRPDRAGWGETRCRTDAEDELCDLSFLPAGSYSLLTDGRNAEPVVLQRRARPVVLDPDVVGGVDYAASDPWDGDKISDVEGAGNVEQMTFGDRLTAVNAPPVRNDPHVWLALRSPTIDTSRFHRLTVRSGYDGPFRLEDDEGGGSMGRFVWDPAGDHVVQQTEDIVTYGGTRTVTVDLNAPGVTETDLTDEASQVWASSPAHRVRWDPNEDRGPRTWWLERLAIRADDEAGTSYDIRWHDAGFAPGSRVTISRAEDASGRGQTTIASGIAQHPGTNVYRWDTSSAPRGEHWVAVSVTGPAGSATSWSTGPVQVVGSSLQGQAASPAQPLARDLSDACPQSRVPEDGYADVDGVHERSVDCLAWWGVTRPVGGFSPSDSVSRGQMASFLRRLVETTRGPLPAGRDAFGDDAGVHAANIDALAAAGVVGGFGDGTFRPHAPVSRAQMATFLVRAADYSARRSLPRTADHFTDDDGGTHEAAIDKAAGAGIAGGVSEQTYAPFGDVRRDQMASFLVRTLDLLVQGGTGSPPRS